MIMGPGTKLSAVAMDVKMLPPSYLGSQSGDQIDGRDWEMNLVL